MCVFVSVSKDIELLEKKFKAIANKENKFKPIFSASAYANPQIPLITNDKKDVIQFFNWGFIPSWTKDLESAKKIRNFNVNAKSETLSEKPSFRNVYKLRKCIVLVDGFFEYHEQEKIKIPFYIKKQNHELFALAGLWEIWKYDNEELKTFTIITTEADDFMSKIHNTKKRMPVILNEMEIDNWFENRGDSELFKKSNHDLMAYKVDKKLAKLGFNTYDSGILNENGYD